MLSVRLFSFSLSLCPGGSRNGTGTGKNLKICCRSPSPSKTCVPSDHFPQCSLHGGLYDQWFMRKRRIPTDSRLRRGMEAVGLHYLLLFCVPLSLSLSLSFSLSLFLPPPLALPSDPRGQHLGPFIPAERAGGAPVPSRVAGPKCAAVWVLVVVGEGQGLTSAHGACLDHLKASHPPVPSFSSRPHGSPEPGPEPRRPCGMVSVALHPN